MVLILSFSCILWFFFFQSPDIYRTYVEELKDMKIPYKDNPELLGLILEFSSSVPSLFDRWKVEMLFF